MENGNRQFLVNILSRYRRYLKSNYFDHDAREEILRETQIAITQVQNDMDAGGEYRGLAYFNRIFYNKINGYFNRLGRFGDTVSLRLPKPLLLSIDIEEGLENLSDECAALFVYLFRPRKEKERIKLAQRYGELAEKEKCKVKEIMDRERVCRKMIMKHSSLVP